MRARRGVALLLVLWVVAILGGLGAALAVRVRDGTDLTVNARAAAQARYAAESGVTLAVSTVESELAARPDPAARERYLNALDAALGPLGRGALGDERYAVSLVDVSARLDINRASHAQLQRFFGQMASRAEAAQAAAALEAYRGAEGTRSRPLRSMDELDGVPGLDPSMIVRAAPFLTVDGDGNINQMTAPPEVLAAAGGDLRRQPSRLLVISRGWRDGHPLTHEIQAVYAVQDDRLALVRWQERGR